MGQRLSRILSQCHGTIVTNIYSLEPCHRRDVKTAHAYSYVFRYGRITCQQFLLCVACLWLSTRTDTDLKGRIRLRLTLKIKLVMWKFVRWYNCREFRNISLQLGVTRCASLLTSTTQVLLPRHSEPFVWTSVFHMTFILSGTSF
jgi:hypothetical protein